jgi:hypothetical protein
MSQESSSLKPVEGANRSLQSRYLVSPLSVVSSPWLVVRYFQTQNSKLKTQNSKLKTQNSKLKTQNSKLFPPDNGQPSNCSLGRRVERSTLLSLLGEITLAAARGLLIMDWDLYIQQLQEFALAKPTDPPYVLLFAGLLILLTSGIAFAATLRMQVDVWQNHRSPHSRVPRWEKLKLLFPFLGTIAGFWLFLGSSLEVFSLSPFLSWTISLLLSGGVGIVLWAQLGRRIGQGVVRSYLDEAFKFGNS